MREVCIIIPLYKIDNIDNTLKSVVNSQHNGFSIECIIVDDESNDGCADIAIRFAKRYPDIFTYVRILHKGRSGPSSARNFGIRICDSDYIKFLDDDELLPDTLQRQFDIMDNNSLDIYGESYFVKQNGNLMYMDFYGLKLYDKNEFYEYFSRAFFHHTAFMFKTDLCKKHRFQDTKHEDYIFLYDMVFNCQRVLVDTTKTAFIWNNDYSVCSNEYNTVFGDEDMFKVVLDKLNELNDNRYPLYYNNNEIMNR